MSGADWSGGGDDVLADLQAAIDRVEQLSRETFPAIVYSDELQALAEAFAAKHGYSPPPRPRGMPELSPELSPELQFAVASGMMTDGYARDVDAFTDGITARVLAGELTLEQAGALVEATATRDARAVVRARNRQARRAERAQKRRK